ncbi:MAG: hypothetical protein KDK48_03790 [Chlamydiia bacterium]|nr:hypothetical protein [Chlamydiia bacterium]
MSESANDKIYHVGTLFRDGEKKLLFLKRSGPETYQWFEGDTPTSVKGITPEEACRLARKEWKRESFTPLFCGSRFTLPERDEHGSFALFHQMGASYDSMNGIYYDDELGFSCIVKNASKEALELWRALQ